MGRSRCFVLLVPISSHLIMTWGWGWGLRGHGGMAVPVDTIDLIGRLEGTILRRKGKRLYSQKKGKGI